MLAIIKALLGFSPQVVGLVKEVVKAIELQGGSHDLESARRAAYIRMWSLKNGLSEEQIKKYEQRR